MDYRQRLFDDFVLGRLYSYGPILEIGPKDYLDTRRLMTIGHVTTIDINPPVVRIPGVTHHVGNVMCSDLLKSGSFSLVWCTGVLYHNPEQLRFIRMLRDLLEPGGMLVLESATTRNRKLRHQNCVEILYPPDEDKKRRQHVSLNVTHLPSAQAIASWLVMVGFVDLLRSSCHGWKLGRDRAAFIARKPHSVAPARYYGRYDVGEAH